MTRFVIAPETSVNWASLTDTEAEVGLGMVDLGMGGVMVCFGSDTICEKALLLLLAGKPEMCTPEILGKDCRGLDRRYLRDVWGVEC